MTSDHLQFFFWPDMASYHEQPLVASAPTCQLQVAAISLFRRRSYISYQKQPLPTFPHHQLLANRRNSFQPILIQSYQGVHSPIHFTSDFKVVRIHVHFTVDSTAVVLKRDINMNIWGRVV